LGGTIVAPLKKERKVRVDTFIEPDLNEKLVEYANKHDVPRAKIVERALKEFFERHKDD